MGLTDTIANLYLQKGAAQAQGQERVGQLYGSLISNLGQLPGQIQQQEQQRQAAQQEQQIRGLQITQAQREMAAQDALGKAMSSAVNPDGSFNTDLLQKSVLANPVTAAQWPKISEGLTAAQEKSAQVRKLADEHDAAERDHVSALANAADAVSDPTEKAGVLLAGLAQGAKAGTIDPAHATSIVGQLLGDDGNPDPQKVMAVLGQMKQLSAADVEKRAQAAKAGIDTARAQAELPGIAAETATKQAVAAGMTNGMTAAQAAEVQSRNAQQAREAAANAETARHNRADEATAAKRLNLSGGTAADPEVVAAYVRQVASGGIPLQNVPERERDAVTKALAASGQNVQKLTVQGKQMKETASTLLPMIDKVQTLAERLDKRGLLGTLGGRARNLASVESAAANLQNLTPDDRKLIGEFASAGGLLITGIARAHGGARAGGSPQMVEHLSKLMAAGNKDLPTFLGNLEGERDFMRAYAQMGEAPASPTATAVPSSVAPAGGAPTYQDYLKSRGAR